MSASPSRITVDNRKVDDLEAAICGLARKLHAATYRMIELIREFDDRFGYAKWGHKSCAEWLHWRCQISLSAARKQVRTAQALRRLPKLSAALAKGEISYTKVRALTRVATECDEDLLLAYARRHRRRTSRIACGKCGTRRRSRRSRRVALGSDGR